MKRLLTAMLGLALMGCGESAPAPSPAPPPINETAQAEPPAVALPERAFDASTFGTRCMAISTRRQTDPAVLAASKRICDCMEKTLAPADFDLLLNFMAVDPTRPDYASRLAELHASYGMSENQFTTQLNRIRKSGQSCRSP